MVHYPVWGGETTTTTSALMEQPKKKPTRDLKKNIRCRCRLTVHGNVLWWWKQKKKIQSNRLTWVVVCEWGKLVAACISMPVCVYSCKIACTHTQCFGSLVPVNISVTFPLCFIRLAFVFLVGLAKNLNALGSLHLCQLSLLTVIVIAAFFTVSAQQQALKMTDFPFGHLGKTLVSVFAGPAKSLSSMKSAWHSASTVVTKHW